jgi:hypothetical protein
LRDDTLREFALCQPLHQKQIDGLLREGIPPLWLAQTFSGIYASARAILHITRIARLDGLWPVPRRNSATCSRNR